MKRRQLSILSLAIALASTWGCTKSSGNGGGSGPPLPNALDGHYAFLLTGYDGSVNQHYMAIAGSITADGMGRITGGSVDVNDDLTISTNGSALTGTYTIDSNFRGVITLTNIAIGSVAHPLAFAFTLKADGTSGDLVELLDANTFIVSGTLERQDPTAFSLSALAGDFALELDSRMVERRSLVGRFTLLAASGMSSNAIVDVSVSATGPLATCSSSSFVFAPPGPDRSGRGTFSLTECGSQGTTNYVYYMIFASKFIVIETDAAPANQILRTGVAEKQNLASITVNTAASVFGVTGLDTGAAHTIDAIGVLAVPGPAGAGTGNLHWDSNDAGILFSQKSAFNQAVTFDPATGRGTVTVASGFANGLFDSAVFYLTDSGTGFLVDTTAGVNNRALAGRLQPQTGGGSFGASTLSANAIGYTVAGDATADNGVDERLLSPSAGGAFSALVDERFPNSQDLHGAPFSVTVSGIDPNTGRGTLLTVLGANEILYFIGPNQFVLIDETSGVQAPLSIFDPQ